MTTDSLSAQTCGGRYARLHASLPLIADDVSGGLVGERGGGSPFGGRLVRGKDQTLAISAAEAERAQQEAAEVHRRFDLGSVTESGALIEHVAERTGLRINVVSLPEGLPSEWTGFVTVQEGGRATIAVPDERGVYPLHVLHHELAHVLMWEAGTAAVAAAGDSDAALACEDPYIEEVAESIARTLSAQLLRMHTPRVEQILG